MRPLAPRSRGSGGQDVSTRTLEQWRWQGKGPRYLKIGGRVVYRVEDVEAFEAVNLHVNTIGPIDEPHV